MATDRYEALMLVSMVHEALEATETLVATGDVECRELSGLLMCIARVAKEAQVAVEALEGITADVLEAMSPNSTIREEKRVAA